MKFTIAAVGVLAAASCASAFVAPGAVRTGMAPAAVRSTTTRVMANGKYDGKEWNDDAKADVSASYDPSQPRTELNFDPYAKDDKGNKCDASGYYPGEGKYKDPIRPKVSYADYLAAQAKKAEGN